MHAVACALASVDSIFATLNMFKFECQSGAINSLIAAVEVAVTVHENSAVKQNEQGREKIFTSAVNSCGHECSADGSKC